ncbi:MAG: YlbF family regulator [Gemmatimonadota bacterium]|nr:YlbF family regulator [Gemmatimonadota bacterium]
MDTQDRIFEKAEELGRAISQTPEYAYLQSAHREIGDDREATEMLNKLRDLQESLIELVGRGEQPTEEQEQEFGDLQELIQTSSRYQALISSQANFDKLMEKVHRRIGEGIRKGEESRIILPS